MKKKSSNGRKSVRRAKPSREQVAAVIRRAEWWCRMMGRRMRALREAKVLSQAWVGLRAGLSRQEVSSVERGIHTPWMDTALRIAFAMGLAVDEVFYARKPA